MKKGYDRWMEPDGLLAEYDSFANELQVHFPNAKIRCNAYSGGVPGMSADLDETDYPEAIEWLADKFGQPETKQRWHPAQRRNEVILVFKKTSEMEHGRMSHVNVMRMHYVKRKRHTVLSWM